MGPFTARGGPSMARVFSPKGTNYSVVDSLGDTFEGGLSTVCTAIHHEFNS